MREDIIRITIAGIFIWGCLLLTGCNDKKPDTSGRLDNIVAIHIHTPTMFSVLTKQGDRVILTSFKTVKNTAFVEDIKEGEPMWVEYIQVGDTDDYKSATFHVRNVNKDLMRTDSIQGVQLPREKK